MQNNIKKIKQFQPSLLKANIENPSVLMFIKGVSSDNLIDSCEVSFGLAGKDNQPQIESFYQISGEEYKKFKLVPYEKSLSYLFEVIAKNAFTKEIIFEK